MSESEHRLWPEAEVALLLKMIEESRSIGEIVFILSRTEDELRAKCAELHRDLPREFDTQFFLEVRHSPEGAARRPQRDNP
jgi:hypothetical protein